MFRRKNSRRKSLVRRLVRSIVTIIILSALVLGIVLGIRELSESSTSKIVKVTKPVLEKLGIKVTEEQLGEVAGKFVERISQTNLGSGVTHSREGENKDTEKLYADSKELFKISIMSDIHDDLDSLERALIEAKEEDVEAVFVLGDLTNYGDIESLSSVSKLLNDSGLDYYVLPGDHDLAESVGVDNFIDVFDITYEVVEIKGVEFLTVNNSANFTRLGPIQIAWLENNIEDASFIFLSQPLFTDGLPSIFEDIYMGSTRDEVTDEELKELQEEVETQGVYLLNLFRNNGSVKALIAGDHHKSSSIEDPKRESLTHYVIGAVTDTIDEYPQNVLQSSRFSILTMYEGDVYKVEDVVIN